MTHGDSCYWSTSANVDHELRIIIDMGMTTDHREARHGTSERGEQGGDEQVADAEEHDRRMVTMVNAHVEQPSDE